MIVILSLILIMYYIQKKRENLQRAGLSLIKKHFLVIGWVFLIFGLELYNLCSI